METICFAYGLDVGSGPSLLFVTLPHILQDIPLGRLFAVILYRPPPGTGRPRRRSCRCP